MSREGGEDAFRRSADGARRGGHRGLACQGDLTGMPGLWWPSERGADEGVALDEGSEVQSPEAHGRPGPWWRGR